MVKIRVDPAGGDKFTLKSDDARVWITEYAGSGDVDIGIHSLEPKLFNRISDELDVEVGVGDNATWFNPDNSVVFKKQEERAKEKAKEAVAE